MTTKIGRPGVQNTDSGFIFYFVPLSNELFYNDARIRLCTLELDASSS